MSKLGFFMSLSQGSLQQSTLPKIPAVGANDLIVLFLAGQSNASGSVAGAGGNGPIPPEYAGTLTSKIYNPNATWINYQTNTASVGPDIGVMHNLDTTYPGQVMMLKWGVSGTRLRTDTRVDTDPGFRMDWNVNSTNENWDRMKSFVIGESGNDQGLQKLVDDNPGKNIRLISFGWAQGEADASLDTLAGDDPGLTGAQAKSTYITDLKALFDAFKTHVTSLGFSTDELQFEIFKIGPGSSVTNRDFYTEIVEAEQDVATQRTDSKFHVTDTLDVFDGTHYSVQGQIDLGDIWANEIKSRFA